MVKLATALVLVASLAVAAAANAQPPARTNGQPPPRVVTATDAEILAALKSPNLNELVSVVAPAALLPPHSLRPETLAAIGKEIAKLRAESIARAEAIQKGTIPASPQGDEGTFDHVTALIDVLIKQKDAAGVEGLAEVIDYGNDPFWAVVGHGDAAVLALVQKAGIDGAHDYLRVQLSMDALEQMLESKTIRPTLSQPSRAAIRQLAADRMRTLTGDKNWRLFAAAADLAVATGDPQLRKEVEDVMNNDGAFVRRGMNVQSQQKASELIQQALDKFRN